MFLLSPVDARHIQYPHHPVKRDVCRPHQSKTFVARFQVFLPSVLFRGRSCLRPSTKYPDWTAAFMLHIICEASPPLYPASTCSCRVKCSWTSHGISGYSIIICIYALRDVDRRERRLRQFWRRRRGLGRLRRCRRYGRRLRRGGRWFRRRFRRNIFLAGIHQQRWSPLHYHFPAGKNNCIPGIFSSEIARLTGFSPPSFHNISGDISSYTLLLSSRQFLSNFGFYSNSVPKLQLLFSTANICTLYSLRVSGRFQNKTGAAVLEGCRFIGIVSNCKRCSYYCLLCQLQMTIPP